MQGGPPPMMQGPGPMGGPNLAQSVSAAERQERSVFVGNIPYDATEEELKEVFCQAGPVMNFRLVFDRDTGKAKGYGFCEYLDIATAESAIRNLNNIEFHGRSLRVDSAAGDKNREQMRALQMTFGSLAEESPYGAPVDPEKAPEAISRAVASLPPEQMFELMKQMKQCIQNNPNEARTMLMQNPQLAYALLQAQVVMRIVEPNIAISMLHRGDTLAPVQMLQPTPTPLPLGAMPMGGGPMMGGPPQMMGGPPMPMPLGALQVGPPRPMMMHGGPPTGGDIDYRQLAMRQPMQGAKAPSASPQDEEKAQLILQVLQLSDEQIAALPPEQRQSVLLLKEQLKSTAQT